MSTSWAQYALYLQYMVIGVAMTAMFATVYLRITPVREVALIKEGNLACALSFGGALVGFCIALASSITHSLSVPDFMLWGLAAGVLQIIVYFAATRLINSGSVQLAQNNVAVGALYAAMSVAIGILNAACLT
ncbi:DUF350 domain-containing protein [Neisseriaceae bacterium B1]